MDIGIVTAKAKLEFMGGIVGGRKAFVKQAPTGFLEAPPAPSPLQD